MHSTGAQVRIANTVHVLHYYVVCTVSSSCSLAAFVDAIKISSNILQRCSSAFTETCCKEEVTVPGDREGQVRNRLSEILQAVDGILLRGKTMFTVYCVLDEHFSLSEDLPHDVILAAAMLSVVLRNILHCVYQDRRSQESCRKHEEVVKHWLSLPGLCPFSKLALCHAFLAKIPTLFMLCMDLNGEQLIMMLFPVVCQLFNG